MPILLVALRVDVLAVVLDVDRADGPRGLQGGARPPSAWPPACSPSARSPGRCWPPAGRSPSASCCSPARSGSGCSRSPPASPRRTRSTWLLLVPAGIALITINTAANASVQLATSPEMRGRVMGIYMLVFTGGTPSARRWSAGCPSSAAPGRASCSPACSYSSGTAARGAATKLIAPGSRAGRRPPPDRRGAQSGGMRLFAAVVPPDEVLDELERAIAPHVGQVPGLRWPDRATWHITLAFFGEVPERVLPDLRGPPGPRRPPAHRPDPGLHRVRGLLVRARARVFWAGLSGDPMTRLADSVRAGARRAGAVQTDEKRFHPHLTLAERGRRRTSARSSRRCPNSPARPGGRRASGSSRASRAPR